jgi:hypothetical protein
MMRVQVGRVGQSIHAGRKQCAVVEGIMVAERVGCTDSLVYSLASIPLPFPSESFMRPFPSSFPLW